MEPRVVKIFRCKRCSLPVRQRDQLQSHLHWHGIKDQKFDLYFEEVDEVEAEPAANEPVAGEMPTRRQTGPSLSVLIVSLALLALMGVVYVVTS